MSNNNKKKEEEKKGHSSSIIDKIKNVDDKALLLSIVRDLPDYEEFKGYISVMTPEQARKSVKGIHESIMASVSDETKLTMALSTFAINEHMGVAPESYMIQLSIEGNDRLRNFIASKMKMAWVGDDALKKRYRAAKKEMKKDDTLKNCHFCGVPTPPKGRKMCSSCRSVSYCSRECQVKDWKEGGHKKECRSLSNRRVDKTQPLKPTDLRGVNIPWICLGIPPSITGCEKEVKLHLPMWDFDDKELVRSIRRDCQSRMIQILQNVKMFFKLEGANGETDTDTVGDMCVDAFMLHVLGYKDIRVLCQEEVMSDNVIDNSNFSDTYFHYTKVPKGWCIPPQHRPFIPPDLLSSLEEGIEMVRKTMGEREALS